MGRKYRNPPIVEAVCEFRFDPTSPWDMAIPGLIYDGVKDPFRRRAQERVLTLNISPPSVTPGLQTAERIRFLRDDERAFIQVSEHLLAVNHLSPYPSWEGFRPSIHQAFETYRRVAQPKRLQRIGLRYINSVFFENDRLEPSEYFNIYPRIGEGLPQDYYQFGLVVYSLYENKRDTLKIELGSVLDAASPRAIIIDLDYSLVQPDQINLDDALAWVETAHANIEQAFEACITDRLRERFEEAS